MNLLPTASGSRPRLAVELFPGGVVAGSSPEPGLPLAAVARIDLPEHAVVPGLRPGNLADRVAIVAALRRALEQVGGRSNARNADLTLVIPDAAVRVLLLDFDTLPGKLSEALPIVRFRLKKLVPFDPDQAMVSFQVMSTSRILVRVLAVAIPRDVLGEYESAVREAGFEPGSVLPSTLAALAALKEGDGASLVVNAHADGVTTAIVRAGIVLLHRGIELAEFPSPLPAFAPASLFEPNTPEDRGDLLIVADRTAIQVADIPEADYRAAYADRAAGGTIDRDEIGRPEAPAQGSGDEGDRRATAYAAQGGNVFDMYASEESTAQEAPLSRSPYASPALQQQLDAQFHNAAYIVPSAAEALAPHFEVREDGPRAERGDAGEYPEPPTHTLAPDMRAEEIARAVSVAMAYFEDSLSAVPEVLVSAGPLGAEALNRTLREQGVALEDDVRVRELVATDHLSAAAVSAKVPRGWLAGITGALQS